MFYRLLSKAIQRRKLRIALAVLAVIMGATIASTLLTISYDLTLTVEIFHSSGMSTNLAGKPI
jgi:hypothetical protein